MSWRSVVLMIVGTVAACGGSGGDGSGSGAGAPGSGAGGGAQAGGTSNGSGGGGSGGGPVVIPQYGRYGTASLFFTLPKPVAGSGKPVLSHPDLMTEHPEVDWENLDRLYLPAGEYRGVILGGLPKRSLDKPLVITNTGGQVKIGGEGSGYLMSIRGGSGWVLTGRYDPESKTGDAAFRGHVEGAFAHSQGSYGIFIDDEFSKEGVSGIVIGSGATDFELDTIEVTRAEFAGISIKTDDQGDALMSNVHLHDLYVHDVGSEGLYLGSTQAQPQHAFEGLRIHNNRFLRTGTEALQVGQLGDDCEIHHNVLGPAAIRWRSAFQRYQDGNVQYGQRYGSSHFHHNVVIGTGDLFIELFPTLVAGDPRSASDEVVFSDCYFSDTSSGGVYTHATDTGVTIRFERNVFRGFDYTYNQVFPDAKEPVQVFGVGSSSPNPHVLVDNTSDAPYPFIKWLFESVTQERNREEEVPPIQFRDFMVPALDESYRRLEWWTDRATLHPDQPLVTYAKGTFVVHQGDLYEALAANENAPPDQHPELWRKLPAPADDVRLTPDSPHQGVGLQQP